jgi:hypothetical protein
MQSVPLRDGAALVLAKPGRGTGAPSLMGRAERLNQILTEFVAGLDALKHLQPQRRLPERPVIPAT